MPDGGRRDGPGSGPSLRRAESRAAMRGRSLRGERVIVYVARARGPSRAAFVASRRVGGAVVRNRARRILREAWRALVPSVREGHHVVLVARREIVGAKAGDVTDEVRRLLVRAGVAR